MDQPVFAGGSHASSHWPSRAGGRGSRGRGALEPGDEKGLVVAQRPERVLDALHRGEQCRRGRRWGGALPGDMLERVVEVDGEEFRALGPCGRRRISGSFGGDGQVFHGAAARGEVGGAGPLSVIRTGDNQGRGSNFSICQSRMTSPTSASCVHSRKGSSRSVSGAASMPAMPTAPMSSSGATMW